jgi:hypothetical protein
MPNQGLYDIKASSPIDGICIFSPVNAMRRDRVALIGTNWHTLGRALSPIAKFRKDFGPHPVFGSTPLFGAIARLQLNTAVAELKVVCGDDTPRRAMIEHRRT